MGAVALTAAAPILFVLGAEAGPRGASILPLLQSKTAKPAQGSSAAKPQSKPGAKKKPVSRRRRPRGQQAPTADRIKEIQLALAREGHYRGEPTGKWDNPTIQAVKSYQQASELTPSGKLDAKTLQKLGLGSDIAGQAPPRATPSAERASDNPRN
jgi:peptidoglycan hydrolase-like protein with peptidoglycan-binding domain